MSASYYEPFANIRGGLCWSPEQLVAMFRFYGDAAFGPGNDYLVVAGYVATATQWENRFCPDWRLTLAKAGLPEFRASAFFNGVDPFVGWNQPDKEGARTLLLRNLSEIITSCTLQAFACAVHLPSWNDLNGSYMLEERCLTPYALCGRTVVKFVRQWCAKTRRDASTVEYFFDQGDHDWGDLIHRLRTDLDIEPIPGDRRKLRPLQAADWLAYEIFREIPQSETVRVRPMRKSLVSLMYVPSEPQIYRKETLRELCERKSGRISRRALNDPKYNPSARNS